MLQGFFNAILFVCLVYSIPFHVCRMIEFFNSGRSNLGVLLYCDFLPQQFGFDANQTVKILDVEGLVPLPGFVNFNAFFLFV